MNPHGDPSDNLYNADILRNALGGAHAVAASATAATAAATERLGATLGEFGSKAASGEAFGAAGLVLTTQSPAGNAGEDAPNATWRQHSNAISDHTPQQTHTTYPGHRVDVGPNHTAHPASAPDSIRDRVHTTPAETSTKPLHTGRAAPDVTGLTKPTGTAIHRRRLRIRQP